MALRGLICARLVLHCKITSPRTAVFNGEPHSSSFNCRIGARRFLLSEDVVKLQDFQQRKLAVAQQVSGSKGNFFQSVNKKMEKNELILKDELQKVLLLCQSPEDVVVARNAIYRYHKENYNLANGEFLFGPLFMRLCYELGLDDLAVSTLTDKRLKGFFSDCTSFNLAIDLLFTKGHFAGALELLREMQTQGVTFNKDTYTLAVATCYKLNTPKSYHICLALLEDGQTKDTLIPRHAHCIAVALALKQEDLKQARSIYARIMNTDNQLCQNLRLLMYSMDSETHKDAILVLKKALLFHSSAFVKKPEFCQDVIDLLREKSEDGHWKLQVENLVRQLQQAGQINAQNLDEILCYTPTKKRRLIAFLEKRRKTNQRPLRSLLCE